MKDLVNFYTYTFSNEIKWQTMQHSNRKKQKEAIFAGKEHIHASKTSISVILYNICVYLVHARKLSGIFV